jgi:hypothetical protein
MIPVEPELHDRVVDVLRKLERVSEGRTITIGGIVHGASGDGFPLGINPDRPRGKPPPAVRSLFEHFRWKLERATDQSEVRLICRAAELAYDETVKGPEPTARHRRERDAQQEARWVVEHGVGLPADEIAAELQVSPGWVEKVRRENRQRGPDGRPMSGFLGWDDERRYREVQKLRMRGVRQSAIAAHLRVSERTIRKYWIRPRSLAA